MSLKKGYTFKDLSRNIELNICELANSRLFSQKFLMGKLPAPILLQNPEAFSEKMTKIAEKLKTSYTPSKPDVQEVSKEGKIFADLMSISKYRG